MFSLERLAGLLGAREALDSSRVVATADFAEGASARVASSFSVNVASDDAIWVSQIRTGADWLGFLKTPHDTVANITLRDGSKAELAEHFIFNSSINPGRTVAFPRPTGTPIMGLVQGISTTGFIETDLTPSALPPMFNQPERDAWTAFLNDPQTAKPAVRVSLLGEIKINSSGRPYSPEGIIVFHAELGTSRDLVAKFAYELTRDADAMHDLVRTHLQNASIFLDDGSQRVAFTAIPPPSVTWVKSTTTRRWDFGMEGRKNKVNTGMTELDCSVCAIQAGQYQVLGEDGMIYVYDLDHHFLKAYCP